MHTRHCGTPASRVTCVSGEQSYERPVPRRTQRQGPADAIVKRDILVVDDDEHIREVLGVAFQATGRWAVSTAPDADEACAKFAARRPAVVLTDWDMPGGDGPELCRRLRQIAPAHDVPIVMLTAKVGARLRPELRRLGVRAVLAKPFDPFDLLEQVAALLEDHLHAS